MMSTNVVYTEGRSYECCIHPKQFTVKPTREDVARYLKRELPENRRKPTGEVLTEAIAHGQTWTPAVLTGTKAASWVSQQLIAIDIDNDVHIKDKTTGKEIKVRKDDPLTIEKAEAMCAEYGLTPAMIYESFSSSEDWPRYRIVWALDAPITDPERMKHLLGMMVDGLFKDHSDSECTNLDRLFYGTTPNKIYQYWDDGAVITADQIDALPFSIKEPKTESTKTSPTHTAAAGEYAAMLSAIDADCQYSTWVTIGMKLKDLGLPFEMWRDWSATGSSYNPRRDHLERKWEGFRGSGDPDMAHRYIAKLAWIGGYRPQESTRCFVPGDLSDAGAAQLFAELYGEVVRYSPLLGWLVWDSKIWAASESLATEAVITFTKQMLNAAYAQERAQDDLADAPRQGVNPFTAFARKARSARTIRAIRDLSTACRTSDGELLTIDADHLDADPYLLNTPDGIVDLRSGTIAPHDSRMLCTRMTTAGPGSKGREMWEKFVTLATCGDDGPDPQMAHYLKCALGSSLIGKVLDEHLLIAIGGGRNGKSTLFNAILRVMGDYGGYMNADVLLANARTEGQYRSDLASLRGKRLVVCGELRSGCRMNEAALKRLTSTDPISAKLMYKNAESFIPSHSLCMFSNVLPRVADGDDGTWRRLVCLPFDAVMPTGGSEVKNYASVLADQAGPAIMQWLIEGCREYLANDCKLQMPERVLKKSAEYRSGEDWIMRFLSECCSIDRTASVGHTEIYTVYQAYATKNGEPFIHKRTDFLEAMNRCGYRSVNWHNKLQWKGLALNDMSREYIQ